jgi:CDP-glycerol glycerophosphotransferase (TagB/SpsB family)
LTLYQLAGLSDSLISDISSIVVDFMLLDRPTVILFQDINQYRGSRGFVFSPIEEWLPARVNTDYTGFIDDVTAVLAGEDRYLEKRNKLKKEFFAHHDARATERILDHAFLVGTAAPSAE